jgi:hypothetical protein
MTTGMVERAAARLVRRHRLAIALVAAALAEKLELTGAEIDAWIVRPVYAMGKLLEDRARADYYLSAGTASSDYMRRTLAGLTQGLAENGMIESRDFILETRFAEGDYERFPKLALELQHAKVRIILPLNNRRGARGHTRARRERNTYATRVVTQL